MKKNEFIRWTQVPSLFLNGGDIVPKVGNRGTGSGLRNRMHSVGDILSLGYCSQSHGKSSRQLARGGPEERGDGVTDKLEGAMDAGAHAPCEEGSREPGRGHTYIQQVTMGENPHRTAEGTPRAAAGTAGGPRRGCFKETSRSMARGKVSYGSDCAVPTARVRTPSPLPEAGSEGRGCQPRARSHGDILQHLRPKGKRPSLFFKSL